MFFFLKDLVLCLIKSFLFLHDIAVLWVWAKVFFNHVIFQIFSDVLLIYDLELLRELSNEALNDSMHEEAGGLFFEIDFD